jgi:hypothetical protein
MNFLYLIISGLKLTGIAYKSQGMMPAISFYLKKNKQKK